MAGGSPTVSSTTKSSSPPAGTPSMITFEIAMCAAVKAFSASLCCDSAALTVSASSFAAASRAGRSSGEALPTFLLAAFCSARRLSADDTAARRAASDSRSASTRPGSSPRARCDARRRSGFSRSSLRSITGATLLSAAHCRTCRGRRLRHNPITLQLHQLSQHLTRLSQWSRCLRHPPWNTGYLTWTSSPRRGRRGGAACRPSRRAGRCC